MKNYLKFILLFAFTYLLSGLNAQTVTPRAGTSTQSLQAVEINTVLAVKKGVDTLNQSARYTYGLMKDGSGNTVILRLNDIHNNTYAATNLLTDIKFNGTNYIPDVLNAVKKLNSLLTVAYVDSGDGTGSGAASAINTWMGANPTKYIFYITLFSGGNSGVLIWYY